MGESPWGHCRGRGGTWGDYRSLGRRLTLGSLEMKLNEQDTSSGHSIHPTLGWGPSPLHGTSEFRARRKAE